MGKSKIYMETLVSVPESIYDEMIGAIREAITDAGLDMTVEELKAHPGVDEFIRTTFVAELEQYATELDVWNFVDTASLRKALKSEYQAAEKKRKREEAALEKERLEAARVNKLEEERLRKEGRSLVVPFKDSDKAEAILLAAGINVKLLP